MAKDLISVHNGRMSVHLHPGQSKAYRSKARFTFVLAGTQSGKTSFGPLWLHKEIMLTADAAGKGNDYIAATASYDLFKLKMLPAMLDLFEHQLQIGRYWSSDRVIELRDPDTGLFWAQKSDERMWGRIVLRSAAGKGGLESMTARAAWLDECGQDEFTLETWEAVLRRLSLSRGRVLGTTTPYNLGWIKREIYDPWVAGNRDIRVIQFPSYLNPLFSKQEYERAKATMPLHRFLMFYDGMFARPAGLIYGCFDDVENIVDDFAIPSYWPVTVGVDFGAVNTALVWIARNPETDVLYLYRESLQGDLTTEAHAKQYKALAAKENVVHWVGGAPGETQQRMDWGAEGIPVMQPYVADVEAGIARVFGLFATRRLRVFRSCKGVLDEVGTYRRKLNEHGEALEEIQDKRKFHRLDGLRYAGTAIEDGAVVNIGGWR